MPISEKILKQVETAKASEDEKKLMLAILQIEDKGSFRYTDDYEKIIKDYVNDHEEMKE